MELKAVEYKIVTAVELIVLAKYVNEQIYYDFEPVGNVTQSNTGLYMQAMVRRAFK
jgi:hypothetical protein